MPDWVDRGYQEYAKRLTSTPSLTLTEVPAGKRSKGQDGARAKAEEGKRLLAAIPRDAHVIAFDERGKSFSTKAIAERMSAWRTDGARVAFLIGGPDGLAKECVDRANETWSLSAMTLPHGLVRILVAEQLYRAASLLANHPYHRE